MIETSSPHITTNIYIGKYLLALKCLLAASELDPEHSKVHEQIIRFKLALDKDSEILPPKSAEVIKSEFTLLPASVDLLAYNDEYLSKHKNCARRTLSALKVRKLLKPDSASAVEKDVAAVVNQPTITMEEAIEALDVLTLWKSSEVNGCRTKAAVKWPHATIFAAKA